MERVNQLVTFRNATLAILAPVPEDQIGTVIISS